MEETLTGRQAGKDEQEKLWNAVISVMEKWQEISQQEAGALYRLEIGNEFYASADSIRDLLDEVDALDGLARG